MSYRTVIAFLVIHIAMVYMLFSYSFEESVLGYIFLSVLVSLFVFVDCALVAPKGEAGVRKRSRSS